MILILIAGISIIQGFAYLVINRIGFKYGRILVLIVVFAGYLFFLPKLFYPKPDPNGVNCGMPILGITLGFWIFGGLSASFTHIFVGLALKKKDAEQQIEN